jgi:UDP-N-acetylglucosamine transferase subunit ALG13
VRNSEILSERFKAAVDRIGAGVMKRVEGETEILFKAVTNFQKVIRQGNFIVNEILEGSCRQIVTICVSDQLRVTENTMMALAAV